jgi:hypothetical protein
MVRRFARRLVPSLCTCVCRCGGMRLIRRIASRSSKHVPTGDPRRSAIRLATPLGRRVCDRLVRRSATPPEAPLRRPMTMPHSRRSRASGQAYTPRTIRAARPTRPPDAPTPTRPLGSVTGIYGHRPLEPPHDVPTPMLRDIGTRGRTTQHRELVRSEASRHAARVERYHPGRLRTGQHVAPAPHRRLNRCRAGECRAPDDLPRIDVDIARCAGPRALDGAAARQSTPASWWR